MKKRGWILLSLFFVILDQGIKCLIRKFLTPLEKWVIIPHFFSITYVENHGGAWSVLSNFPLFFLLVSSSVSLFLLVSLWTKKFDFWKTFSLTLLLGGAVGNLVDRLFLGAVTDYLAFTFGSYAFPVFNMADFFVVVGVILFLGMELWRDYKDNFIKKDASK